jgi:hypothetical protein
MIEQSRKDNFNIGDDKKMKPVISSTTAAFNNLTGRNSYENLKPVMSANDFKKASFVMGTDNVKYTTTQMEGFNLKQAIANKSLLNSTQLR